jgi:hypothetical protein
MRSAFNEGREALKQFEETMQKLFRAPRPPKQEKPPRKRASGEKQK